MTSMARKRRRVTFGWWSLAFAALAGAGCGDAIGPVGPGPSAPPIDHVLSAALLVSRPIGAAPNASLVAGPPAPVSEMAVYVSLQPGEVPDGVTAVIADNRTGFATTTPILNGGFDPQRIVANLDDTVRVDVVRSRGDTVHAIATVPASSPPKIVRTSPPQGQTDVAVNTSLLIVFSEPVAGATLTATSVTLKSGAVPVAGVATLVTGSPWTAEFTPTAPLAPATTFTLAVTTSITGLTGVPLATSTTVAFSTTAGTATGSVASVGINQTAVSLAVGASIQLTAVARDGAGLILPGRSFEWTSSNPGIAAVTPASGFVTAIATGQVTITASSEGKQGSAQVLVVPAAVPAPATSITILPSGTTILAGELQQLTAEVRDARFGILPGRTVKWTSSNPALATISPSGLLVGVAAGSLTIRATSDAASTTIDVVVLARSSGLGPFASVTAGQTHTCALTTTGTAYCWGDNQRGELGNGTMASSRYPVAVAGGLTFSSISAGSEHTCGLTVSGEAYCWGYNVYGELGDGTQVNRTIPVPVAGGRIFASLATGGFYDSCGVTPGGAAYCWGWGWEGELGHGPPSPWDSPGWGHEAWSTEPTPVSGDLRFAKVTTGNGFTCGATTSGEGYCWGLNMLGGLGTGTSTAAEQCYDGSYFGPFWCAPVPMPVTGGLRFAEISAELVACGLVAGGEAYCWGYDREGEVGSGSLVGLEQCDGYAIPCNTRPIPVAGGLRFASITAGGSGACGVTFGGAAYCWGNNLRGAVGDGSNTDRASPTAVLGGLQFAMLNAGRGGHTCGVSIAGAIYCWGLNDHWQLGTTATLNSNVPVGVVGQ